MELYRSEPKRKKQSSNWSKPLGFGIVGILVLAGIVYLLTQVNFSSGQSASTPLTPAGLPLHYEGNVTWKGPQEKAVEHCVVKLTLSSPEKNKQWINFNFLANISNVDTTIRSSGHLNLTNRTIDLPGLGKGRIEIISKENINLMINQDWVLHNTH